MSLYKQYSCVWYQKVWCLPMINTQSQGFCLPFHSNKGNSLPDSAVSLSFSSSRLQHRPSLTKCLSFLFIRCVCPFGVLLCPSSGKHVFGCSLQSKGYQLYTKILLMSTDILLKQHFRELYQSLPRRFDFHHAS